VPTSTRSLSLSAAVLTAALSTLLFAVAPAGAVVRTVEGQTYGIAPAESSGVADTTHPLNYEKGPVVHSSASYLLFWAPQTAPTLEYPQGAYSGESERIISEFFRNTAAESNATANVFAVATQYREGPTGPAPTYHSSFHGPYTDTEPFVSNEKPFLASEKCALGTICLTTAQIRNELVKFITANSLPSGINPTTGATPIYFVLTPPGVDVCAGGVGATTHCSEPESSEQICSYHSFIPAESGHQTILYAVLPWSAGNYGTVGATPTISGSACQDNSGSLQEPNQIGRGPDGEFNAGLADVIVNQAADEHIATVTNPLFTGWHDSQVETGNTDELPDKCRTDFLGGLLLAKPAVVTPPGSVGEEETYAGQAFNQTIAGGNYYINDEFDQAALFEHYPGVRCINRDNIVPKFTAQANVANEQMFTFNTTESVIDLGIAKYHWDFGDETTAEVKCEAHTPTNGYAPEECNTGSGIGNPNPVASVVHKYAYGGTYKVTLTVTDDGGNKASVEHAIPVEGPGPPPAPGPAGGASTAASATTGVTSPAGSTSPSNPVIPGPVATQVVASHSLRKVLRSGLVVSYSVNEQVAGEFQVLLAASVAKRIGLHGAPATGLAAGTPPQIVIAKAILITTKGGGNTVKILFGKKTAAKLRKLRKVTLMVRLVVRNASHSPLSTTVLSTVNLFH
jgi:PKD repeat protein